MPTYNQLYDANKADVYKAFGGNPKTPDMDLDILESLRTSWLSMVDMVLDDVPNGWFSFEKESPDWRALQERRAAFSQACDEAMIDANIGSGRLNHPAAFWQALGPMAAVMTNVGTGVATPSPIEEFFGIGGVVDAISSGIGGAIDDVKKGIDIAGKVTTIAIVAAVAIGGYLLYQEVK